MAALTKAVYDSAVSDDDDPPEPTSARLLPGGTTVAALLIVLVALAGIGVWRNARAADEAHASEQAAEQSVECQAEETTHQDPAAAPERDAPSRPASHASPSSPGSAGQVIVYVSGAVATPGVLTLPASSRVTDAITAAGGALEDADLDTINLARPLTDGEHIRISRIGETPPAPTANGDATHAACVRLDTATATWATTWWATTHPAPHPLIATCALAAAITATSYSWSHRHTRPPRHALTPPRSLRLAAALILAATACALAVASAAGCAYRDDPARMDSGPIHARVRLERDPAPASSGFSTKRRARVRILAVRVGEQWLTSGATALVSAPGWEDAARGDVYEISGSLDASFAAAAPSVGSIRARTAILAERPGGLDGWRRDTHRAFARACEHLARDARGLVPGMAIGDDRLVPSDLSDAMKATSLTHLTAVSGSHIVIILAALTLILPARVPLRVGATLAVLGTIVVLVGPEASVVRSVCVASVAALGLILGREGQAIAALGAVVIGTLLIDPWASRSYGFALSALAALAVVGPAADIVRSTKRRIRGDTRIGQVLRRLTEMVCVPALAEFATAPLVVSLSGSVPVWGIAANVAAEPAVPVATLAGLAGALLAPISPGIAEFCARVASWATGWIASSARFFEGMPGSGTQVPGGARTILSLYACAGCGWVLWCVWRRWVVLLTDEAWDPHADP